MSVALGLFGQQALGPAGHGRAPVTVHAFRGSGAVHDPERKVEGLTSDDQALAKVRAGSTPDIVHPCVSYVKDWVDLGYVQPWDTSLLKNFDNPQSMPVM